MGRYRNTRIGLSKTAKSIVERQVVVRNLRLMQDVYSFEVAVHCIDRKTWRRFGDGGTSVEEVKRRRDKRPKNAPKICRDYLKAKQEESTSIIMEWLQSKSLDLNPIQSLWNELDCIGKISHSSISYPPVDPPSE
ncbi:hypothetical protein Trydic_g7180 [Trypoxylus dichotomus]